jgi:hypothetical protein
MMMYSQELLNYLKNDRQWTREMRIAHAKYMIKAHPERADFFKQVLEANDASGN